MKFRPVYFYLICLICRPLVNFPKIYQCWQSWFLTTFETTINVKCHLKYPQEGAWIAEWSSHSTFDHQNATPWAVRSILGDDYSFLAQAWHLCSTFSEDGVKEAEKQLLLLFVKKLLKFVMFMKVCWKLRKWRIKLFKKNLK